ncbi:MAG: NERD domain-containing protein [Verrucomicrobia bacterium]|nr:NERD domain-containing protein [Verrucomicrobiota bacterium]
MARILTDETSLDKKQKALVKEERVLSRILYVEAALAAVLLLAGIAVFFTSSSPALLWIGGFAAFVFIGHMLRIREGTRERGMVGAGRSGELKVTRMLNDAFGNDTYLLNDVSVAHRRHKAQIDHLVVSPAGIFVLETKNWRGHLSGSERGERWLQVKDAGGKPVSLSNPILQNDRHMEVLKGFLSLHGIQEERIYSVIVMGSPSATWTIEDRTVPVLNIADAIQYMAHFEQPNILSDQEIDRIIAVLCEPA